MSNKKSENQDNIDVIIDKTFNHIKDIVDANTVVGTTIKLSNSTYVIPVSKISVGIVSGGGVLPKGNKKKDLSNAGSGTGFNIIPIGFVTVSDSIFGFLPVNTENISKTIVDSLFKIYEKLTEHQSTEGDENESKN